MLYVADPLSVANVICWACAFGPQNVTEFVWSTPVITNVAPCARGVSTQPRAAITAVTTHGIAFLIFFNVFTIMTAHAFKELHLSAAPESPQCQRNQNCFRNAA